MYNAINNRGERVSADNADRNEKYFCPVCNNPVILKSGDIRLPHFAHCENECEDLWNYDMSEWHRKMQNMFPAEYQEVVVKGNGKTHRADVMVDDIVIEFQHSLISVSEFDERNQFYSSIGKKIAWVFDVSEQYEREQICYKENGSNQNLMIWKYPLHSMCNAPGLYDGNHEFALWLSWIEEGNDCFHRVIWAPKDEGDGTTYSFNRFIMSPITIEAVGPQNAKDFLSSKHDYIMEQLKEYPKYELKKIGEKGFKPDTYVCPKKGNFGLKVFTEEGCLYCKHCAFIEKFYKSGKNSYNVYCCFPEIVQEKIENAHPGYEYYATLI